MLKHAPLSALLKLPWLVLKQVVLRPRASEERGEVTDATGTIGIGRSLRETPGAWWVLLKASVDGGKKIYGRYIQPSVPGTCPYKAYGLTGCGLMEACSRDYIFRSRDARSTSREDRSTSTQDDLSPTLDLRLARAATCVGRKDAFWDAKTRLET